MKTTSFYLRFTIHSMSVDYEERGGVAFVRLNRPERRNALTFAMLDQLAQVFASVRGRRDLRAVVVAGAGPHFCAGSDIAELQTLDAEGARSRSVRGQSLCDAIESCGVPVIAAIGGAAAGGGCELALACHLRIADEDAFFSLPETVLGLIPAYGGTRRLPRATGHAAALSAMLANDRITARDALRLGLVNLVVPAGEAPAKAKELARRIADEAAPLAVRACLEAVTRGAQLPLADGLALETELFAGLFATEDAREGTRAFLEKRRPVFKGN